jgi:ATP-dependent Clp protease protease subunit
MRKFWNFSENESEQENILRIDGYIAEESWFQDDVTPKQLRAELAAIKGDLTVYINSGGGDCFAASEIYTALKEYAGTVTIKIDGIAASAASVIAMSGDVVLMSPTSLMMIHNPSSMIFGEVEDLERGKEMLTEVKESIINAYELRTGIARTKLSHMMNAETWMNARQAVELGFADKMMFDGDSEFEVEAVMWNRHSMAAAVATAMRKKLPKKQTGTSAESLYKRLSLLQ